MGYTSQLKKQVDLPVWEWLRFSPNASSAGSWFAGPEIKVGRYIYGFMTSVFQRYDTVTDGWQLLSSPMLAFTSPTAMRYDNFHGPEGRIISSTANTMTICAFHGRVLVGKTVRIIAGTGAGQTRIITSVDDPVLADTMVATAITVTSITDSTKSYAINQWRDYSVRTYNPSATLPSFSRRILYNNATSVTWADLNWQSAGIEPQSDFETVSVGSSTAGSATIVNIESSVVTVNTPWAIQPDSTSRYRILGGGIWLLTSTAAQFSLQYYDILTDSWSRKSSPTAGFLPATVATDVVLEHTHEGYNCSGIFSGLYTNSTFNNGQNYGYAYGINSGVGNISGISDSSQNWTGNQWKNFRIRVTSGTCAGEERTILSNTNSGITVLQPWNIAPDTTSAYSIVGDSDKLWMMAGNAISSALNQYSFESDLWTPSRIYDYGTVNALGCVPSSTGNITNPPYYNTFALTSITTGAGAVATATTVLNHPLKSGDYFAVYGATLSPYNVPSGIVTSVPSTTTFTYTVTGSPVTPAVAANAQSTSLLVDSTNTWIANQHSGHLLLSITTAGAAAQSYQVSRITANTATTLTVSPVQTLLTNGTMKYLICDNSFWGALTYGIANGTFATTTLGDTTQNWTSNYNSRRVRIITAGGGGVYESPITVNTNTTLTFTAIAAATTASSIYSVLGQPNVAGLGMKLMYVWNNTLPNSNGPSAGWFLKCIFGNAVATLSRFNITTELWESTLTLPFDLTATNADLFYTGTMAVYDGNNRIYFTTNATGRVYCYDFLTGQIDVAGQIPYGMSTALIGNRMEVIETADGLYYLYIQRHTGTEFWRTLLYW